MPPVGKAARGDRDKVASLAKADKAARNAFLAVPTRVAMRKANAFVILDLSAMANYVSMSTNAPNKSTIAMLRRRARICRVHSRAHAPQAPSEILSWGARNAG